VTTWNLTGHDYPGVPITAFGAVGDGVHDDTAAFQRAWDRLGPDKGTVWIPVPRVSYQIGTVDCSGADYSVRWLGEFGNWNVAETPDAGGALIELIDGVNASGFVIDDGAGEVWFEQLFLRGNQAGQDDGTSYAIDFVNSATAVRSGVIKSCRITRWRSGGLHIGNNRNAGVLGDSIIETNGFEPDGTPVGGTGGDGVLMRSASDWRLWDNDIGANTRHGFYTTGANTLQARANNMYSNQGCGLRVDEGAQIVDFIGGSIDRNLLDGAIIVGPTSTTRAYRRLIKDYYFSGNGRETNDTYADIVIHNDPTGKTILDIPTFDKSSAFSNYPKYSIEVTGTTGDTADVVVRDPQYLTGGDAPYVTAFTNDATKLTVK
jgi:hypothetical protein